VVPELAHAERHGILALPLAVLVLVAVLVLILLLALRGVVLRGVLALEDEDDVPPRNSLSVFRISFLLEVA
jgi:hypothetical protein